MTASSKLNTRGEQPLKTFGPRSGLLSFVVEPENFLVLRQIPFPYDSSEKPNQMI